MKTRFGAGSGGKFGWRREVVAMHHLRYVLCLALAIAVQTAPALASYCGPASDAAAIEHLTVLTFNAARPPNSRHVDRTYIMAIVVRDDYAQADVEFAGQSSWFFQKTSGKWTFAGSFPPKSWPASVTKKFAALGNQRSDGSKECTNPNFISRGSG